jgi:hypothetical protein
VLGLWIGLSVGLVAAGLILLVLWSLKARALGRAASAPADPEPAPGAPRLARGNPERTWYEPGMEHG